ncbi:MAG: polysaccharide biosynthesis tyrosine autokinase [Verrucomicrobiota bacterium]|nr:polysaccharide biosynthesis tyrosine autokinase [Verrucomicrobiota bacterium]
MRTARAEHLTEASLVSDIRSLISVLRQKALLITIWTVAGIGIGFLYIRSSPKIYAARAVLQIEQEVAKVEGLKSEDLKSMEVLKTFEQSVVSPEVLLRIIHHHGLTENPAFLPEVHGNRSDNALQEALARHIEAKIRSGTRLIDIKVEHESPELAQRIAELLVLEFARWNFEVRREAGQLASRFLTEEAERLKARLAKSEEALQAYKEQNEAVSLEEKHNITIEKLKELSLRLSQAKSERLKLESDGRHLGQGKMHSVGQLLAMPGIANSPAIVDLKRNVSEKEAQLTALSQRYKPEHPKFINAATEVDKSKLALEQAAQKAAEVLTFTYDAAVDVEKKLEEALSAQQRLALELDKISGPFAALARNIESDRALYEAVLGRLKEITKDIAQDAVRVVARPLLPDKPIKPQKGRILQLSALVGTALGCCLAFVSHVGDRSLTTLPGAEARLGFRPLGEIPRIPLPKRRSKTSPLLVNSDSAAEESFRALRTLLSLIGEDHDRKSFLFTSAHPAEGKSFCAINCAVSFAQVRLKTLLVDADFREPAVDQDFFDQTAMRVDDEGAGDGWERAIQPTHIPNLSILSLGKGGANSAGFLAGRTFEQFMQRAAAQYDRIVIDSAPVFLVSDTLLFAKHVDAVCMVIHAGKTPADDVQCAKQRLEEAGARFVGFVLNQVKATQGYYYERAGVRAIVNGDSSIHKPESVLTMLEPHVRIGYLTDVSASDSSYQQRS